MVVRVLCLAGRRCLRSPSGMEYDLQVILHAPRRFSTVNRVVQETMKQEGLFRFSDYDCVGFDLDNTILRYNVTNIVKLEYEILSKYLVEQRGYEDKFLLKPVEPEYDFLQKGLILDYLNGNILKVAPGGRIERASHGSLFMTDEAIDSLYGKDRMYALTTDFANNMLEMWNGPNSEKIRSLLDYFDIPASLAFARCVDSIDAGIAKNKDTYNLYNDITSGLIYMFSRENFAKDTGIFFPTLKGNPSLYLHKCSDSFRQWLKQLQNEKKVFLLTGSHVDFASFTAKYCLGEDWRDFFDLVVCFAKKPGFFTGRRPFVRLVDAEEKDVISSEDLKFGDIYSQGNWQDLYALMQQETGLDYPRCVYVGDNLVQDVYTPAKFTRCDTVAISEEMYGEGCENSCQDLNILCSDCWGSYFTCKERNGSSLWAGVIESYALVCLPSLDSIADKPLDFAIQTFKCESPDVSKSVGFYPSKPMSML